MVYLIVGEVDVGKTTKIKEIHRKIGRGDGVILEKVFENGQFVGYDAVRLKSGERRRFAVFKWMKPSGWDEVFQHGRFSFSKSGLAFAVEQLEDAVRSAAEPIFIDELGGLELEDKAFAHAFRLALEKGLEIYATCRTSLLQAIIKKFDLAGRCQILKV